MANASTNLDRALQLFHQGSFTECIDLLLQDLEENPENVDTYLYLGYVYAKQNQFDMCAEFLEKAADVDPKSAKVHYNLGVAYQKQHNTTEAKNEFLRALGLDPDYTAPKEALDFIEAAQMRASQSANSPTSLEA